MRILDAKTVGLAVPPAKPTPVGTVVGKGSYSTSIERLTDFGALVFGGDPVKKDSYVIYGIGMRGEDAVIVEVSSNYE